MKRFLSAVLAAAMLLCTLPAAFAASDIETHWAKSYFTALNKIGVINPSSDGEYTPDTEVQRWEFMRYINRAFGFSAKADIGFDDVPAGTVYYDDVQVAVKHGYINGVGHNNMDPTGTLTREQAATIIGRLHKYTPAAGAAVSFTDKSAISDWSIDYVAEAVRLGYINGYSDGSFKPSGKVTRGEIAKMLYFFMGTSLRTQNGSFTAANLQSGTKNVSINVPCTLADATVDGNLYLTEGIGAGAVTLRNVTVKGEIVVSGGDVTMDGVNAVGMVVSSPIAVPQVTCTGNANIASVEVQTSATLRESGLGVSASGLSDLTLNGSGLSLTLDAPVWNVAVKQPASILTTGSTEINDLTADAKTVVSGGGSIQKAKLNASGCELAMKPGTVELASGVTATVAGESVSASTSVSVSPAVLSFDINNTSSMAFSYDFAFNADKNDLARVTLDGETLRRGTDYNLLSDKNGIRVYKAYLTTLKAGSYSMELVFDDGSKAAIAVSTTNSAQTAVSPSSLTFDKYEGSPNYSNQTVTVALPAGTTLDSVKLSSTVLERGSDYTYNATTGTVTLMRDALEKKSAGSYTLTFVPNKGGSLSCSLTITDSAPVNEVSPATSDFDANTASGGYADLTVTLNPADDATLKYIKCGGKTLEEDWQYKENGNTIVLNRSAVSSFATSGASYADFTFVMSSGKNPTLRVNYVTTYALTANVVDDLGQGVSGVSVSFAPSDSAAGTAAQNASTDSDGRATVYVKRGSYTVTASDSRFTAPVSQTVSVSSGRTVKLTGEILETVEITVTNAYGSKLSGAVVTIGGKNVTTGSDGLAAFSLKRATYTAQVSCTGYATQTKAIIVNGTIRERFVLQ